MHWFCIQDLMIRSLQLLKDRKVGTQVYVKLWNTEGKLMTEKIPVSYNITMIADIVYRVNAKSVWLQQTSDRCMWPEEYIGLLSVYIEMLLN